MKPYDYRHRRGVREITWDDFASLSSKLAEQIAAAGVDLVIGIARAGLFPATFVSLALRRELYPIRLTRRVNDEVQFQSPVWRVDIPPLVEDRHVAVVDEIADSGETLALVAARLKERGARRVLTAALVSHSWAQPMPNVAALLTDALVVFPWDRRVFQDGSWVPHPETQAALALKQEDPDSL